ncbi:DNA polymerase III PolC-type [bacterium HR40]|nr:DNA polymerase III PolC-type [bacterium HR40]
MNRSRRTLWLVATILGGSIALPAFVLAAQFFAADPQLARWLGLLGLWAAGLVGVGFLLLDRRLLSGFAEFARALDHALVADPPRRDRLPAAAPGLEPIAAPLGRLLDRLDEAEARLAHERQRVERELEEQRRRLAAILRDLADGLVCCGMDGRILLYNDAALATLGEVGPVGLGRSLFGLVQRSVVVHHLALLRRAALRHAAAPVSEPFVAGTVGGERILRCRLSLIMEPGALPEGFVLVFEDAGADALRLGGELFLERATSRWRGPLASLRAAAEVLQERLAADDEATGFLRIVLEESLRLDRELNALGDSARRFLLDRSPLYDVEVGDVVELLRERLEEGRRGPELSAPAAPLWLAADSFALCEFLAAFLLWLAGFGVERVRIEGRRADERVLLEVSWRGPVPGSRAFEEWLDRPLFPRLGLTARDLAARHGSTPWIAPDAGRSGGFLRLDLPPPRGLHPVDRRFVLPPRPEFYDFRLLEQPPANLADTPLDRLTCVVFDTETTGLDPSQDELVQISAVRVVSGRILRGETFDALVDPGRPIPLAASRIHGITDDMVAGRPPPPLVVARFAEFARDAVLIAHNAAFDLAFLRRWEGEAGVRFDQPVLDTLLLSAVLHEDIDDHSLDGIAERLGVEIRARHNALGDAVATAEVFVRLIELLRHRGIRTLGEALAASRRAALRRQRLAADREAAARGE